MSHGPSTRIYTSNISRSNYRDIRSLVEVADAGTEEEREAVINHMEQNLSENGSNSGYFTYWNHRPDQAVEDYDTLIELFKLYTRVASRILRCRAFLTADHRDNNWFYDNGLVHKTSREGSDLQERWYDELRYRRKKKEVEKLGENLSDDLDKEGQ